MWVRGLVGGFLRRVRTRTLVFKAKRVMAMMWFNTSKEILCAVWQDRFFTKEGTFSALLQSVGKILEIQSIFKSSTHWVIDCEWTRGLPHANTDYYTKSRL